MHGSPSSLANDSNTEDDLKGNNGNNNRLEAPPCPIESSYTDAILHSFVARNKIVLAEAGVHPAEEVLATVQDLLHREPLAGWTTASKIPGSSVAGLKFHVYELIQGADAPLVWSCACVYDSFQVNKRQAQLFLQKIAYVTERLRFMNDTWRNGGYHACKKVFSPTLLQSMQDFAKEKAAHDSLELSKRIICANEKIIHEFEQRKAKKEAEKHSHDLLKVATQASNHLLSWVKPKK